jgi:glucosylceramidase
VRNLSGIAWHCYSGKPSIMTAIHRAAPGLDQIVSECSTGIAPGPTSELLIAALRNWASGVILWNLALNRQGGPVEPPNPGCGGCTGVLTVDQRHHTETYNADYYQLGQLSRFVRPGARRIGSSNFVSYNATFLNHGPNYATDGLDDVAFQNPDGSKVLLAYNTAQHSLRFAVSWHGRAFLYSLPAHATVTFAWS